MKILYIHQNFPAQFVHQASTLVDRGNEVHAISIAKQQVPNGVQIHNYEVSRTNTINIFPLCLEFETKLLRADAVQKVAWELKKKGFKPDIIYAHPGWGEALFLKDVWPNTKLLCYWEFYYHSEAADVNFDPEFANYSIENLAKIRVKNANNLLSLEMADAGISPTHWQKSLFPEWAKRSIRVIHDGIDTDKLKINPTAEIRIEKLKLSLKPGDEVVTFVSRNLEPYRGFHTFMRALPELLKRRPNVKVLIIGGDSVSYGAELNNGQTYKQNYIQELEGQIDFTRVFFSGHIDYNLYLEVLSVSAVHVYLTVPFVLSWSLLEAMSTECLIIGSKTQPVEEVIEDGVNGLLTDFFSSKNLVERIETALELSPKERKKITTTARQTILDRYDLKTICLPQQLSYIKEMIS